MPKKPLHGLPGRRHTIYADNPLWDYINTKQVEHHGRGMSKEVVELLEWGIAARDGEQSLQIIHNARKAQEKGTS